MGARAVKTHQAVRHLRGAFSKKCRTSCGCGQRHVESRGTFVYYVRVAELSWFDKTELMNDWETTS